MQALHSLTFNDSSEASKEGILGIPNWQVAYLIFRKSCICLKEPGKAFTVSNFSKENVKLREKGTVFFSVGYREIFLST